MIRLPWRVVRFEAKNGERVVHVFPRGDLRRHKRSPVCWCNPTLERLEAGVLIGHNSADGRELVEEHGLQ